MAGLLDFLQAASNTAASNISGPVDMLAWALDKAGVPGQKKPVMGSAWLKEQGLMRDVPQSAASLAGETVGLLGPMGVAAKAPQIAAWRNAVNELAESGAGRMPRGAAPRGAITWHGSPHKFDKFDSSKIGTGEGVQAYGPGAYLADARDVGQSYAVNLADPGYLYKVDLPDEMIARMINLDEPIEQAPQALRDIYKRLGPQSYKPGQTVADHMAIDRFMAKELSAKGIPGVRYLDGNSRGAGAGSSNYVVFPGEESALKILERNGKGLLD
jgi:hypothetical protein